MKSLILLQGFALGGGADLPTIDRVIYLGIGISASLIGIALAYFILKTLCPKDKW